MVATITPADLAALRAALLDLIGREIAAEGPGSLIRAILREAIAPITDAETIARHGTQRGAGWCDGPCHQAMPERRACPAHPAVMLCPDCMCPRCAPGPAQVAPENCPEPTRETRAHPEGTEPFTPGHVTNISAGQNTVTPGNTRPLPAVTPGDPPQIQTGQSSHTVHTRPIQHAASSGLLDGQ